MTDKATENVTDATRLQAIREYATARRKAQAAAGLASQVVQKYKKLGVNPAALRAAVKARDADPDEVAEVMRETIRMCALLNMPTTQQELFGADFGTSLPSGVVAEMATWEAEDAGYLAGKAGRGIDSSPFQHQPGSELFVQWRNGWQRGQEAIAYEMGPGGKAASDERRPRGRPRKTPEADTPAANDAPTEEAEAAAS